MNLCPQEIFQERGTTAISHVAFAPRVRRRDRDAAAAQVDVLTDRKASSDKANGGEDDAGGAGVAGGKLRLEHGRSVPDIFVRGGAGQDTGSGFGTRLCRQFHGSQLGERRIRHHVHHTQSKSGGWVF